MQASFLLYINLIWLSWRWHVYKNFSESFVIAFNSTVSVIPKAIRSWMKNLLLSTKIHQVPPRFELGSLDSKSRVLTITPWNPVILTRLRWHYVHSEKQLIFVKMGKKRGLIAIIFPAKKHIIQSNQTIIEECQFCKRPICHFAEYR